MHHTYRSDYSNQVHQLIVSVSKHLYLIKSGQVRYQNKKFDLTLKTLGQSGKEHIIHYLLRDHFSGAFYAEFHSSAHLIAAKDFLLRAWSIKNDYVFCGLPEAVTIPRTVEEAFPGTTHWARSLGVELIDVSSGFQGGIRDVPTVEDYFRMIIAEDLPLSEVQEHSARVSQYLNGRDLGRPSKIEKWIYGAGPLRFPSGEIGYVNKDASE